MQDVWPGTRQCSGRSEFIWQQGRSVASFFNCQDAATRTNYRRCRTRSFNESRSCPTNPIISMRRPPPKAIPFEQLVKQFAQCLAQLDRMNMDHRLARSIDADDVVQSVFRTFFRRSARGDFQIDNSTDLWKLLVRITISKARQRAISYSAKAGRESRDPLGRISRSSTHPSTWPSRGCGIRRSRRISVTEPAATARRNPTQASGRQFSFRDRRQFGRVSTDRLSCARSF